MSKDDKYQFSGYIHGIIHAYLAMAGSLYCAFFADGQEGTDWFNCNYYRSTMFDIQKYFQMFSASWMLYDVGFCSLTTENSNLMMQMYAHHLIGLFGISVGLYMDSFFGSIS